MFQNYALFANKTALDNIAEGLITVSSSRRRRLVPLPWASSQDIGLAEKQDACPASLRRLAARVGIGRAMAAHSKVILFDEPTSALRSRSGSTRCWA